MLLEEKIAIIQSLKETSSYSAYPYLNTQLSGKKMKDRETNFVPVFTKNTSFFLRLLLSLSLFFIIFLLKEKDDVWSDFPINDLQYYLTKHYFLP